MGEVDDKDLDELSDAAMALTNALDGLLLRLRGSPCNWIRTFDVRFARDRLIPGVGEINRARYRKKG